MRRPFLSLFLVFIIDIGHRRVNGVLPTLKARIDKEGFNFAKKFGHNVVEKEIPKIVIPDITIDINAGPGRGGVTAINMTVKKFRMPEFDFQLSPRGISWSSHGGTVKVDGKWKAKYYIGSLPLISQSGWLQALVSGIRIDVTAFAVELDGRPQVEIKDCSANIDNMDIHIGGGILPWLIDLFRGPLSKAVQRAIHDQACETARTILLKQANDYLHSLPLHIPIGDDFYVDYRLSGGPVFTDSFIESSVIADVVFGKKKCTIEPTPMGNETGSQPGMATIWVSEQIGNCLLESAHNGKLIQYLVTKEIEPIANYLKTSCSFLSICIGKFFNKLKKDYPNKYLDLHFYSSEAPKLVFSDDLSTLNTTFAVDFYINPRKENPDVLARLELSSESSVLPFVNGSRVVGVLNSTNVEIREVFSNIGDVSSAFLSMFRRVFSMSTTVFANVILRKGIPIPTFDNVTLSNSSTIDIFDGYLRINADLEYQQ